MNPLHILHTILLTINAGLIIVLGFELVRQLRERRGNWKEQAEFDNERIKSLVADVIYLKEENARLLEQNKTKRKGSKTMHNKQTETITEYTYQGPPKELFDTVLTYLRAGCSVRFELINDDISCNTIQMVISNKGKQI